MPTAKPELRPLPPDLGWPERAPFGYRVSPDVGAIIIEAGRQLGAPIRKDARSQAAFDRALARMIRLAHTEVVLRKYESISPRA